MKKPTHIIGCYTDNTNTSYLLLDIRYDAPDKVKIVRQIDNTYSRPTWYTVYYTPCRVPFFYYKKQVIFLDDFERYDSICPF